MIPHSVSAIVVDIEGGKVPDLYYGQCPQKVSQEHSSGHESSLDMLQKGIVAPNYVYEYQIIDQFQIFYFFLFWFGIYCYDFFAHLLFFDISIHVLHGLIHIGHESFIRYQGDPVFIA